MRDYKALKIENLRGRPDDYVEVAKKSETIMSKWVVKLLINLDLHHHKGGHSSVFKQLAREFKTKTLKSVPINWGV